MQRPGLYYPYVHIRDEDWLKAAALYWPSVRRLVPHGYAKRDSLTAETFASARILRDEEPAELLSSLSSWDLAMALDQNAALLVRDYSLERAHAEWDGQRWADAAGFDEGGPDWELPALGWIHATKFPCDIVDHLSRIGLAQRGRREMVWQDPGHPEEWIGLHPALAGAYMAALARRLSEQERFEPLTDQADLRVSTPSTSVGSAFQLILGHLPADLETANNAPDGVETYVMLALQHARPANLSVVPAEAIVRCRDNLAEELTAFRNFVAAQQAELTELAATAQSRRRLEVFANHVKDTVELPLQNLEKGLRLHRLEPIRSLVLAESLAPPALIGAGVGTVTSSPAVAAAAGAVVAIGNAWWQVEATRADKRRASPLGYLLDVRDQLTPKTLISRARRMLLGTYERR